MPRKSKKAAEDAAEAPPPRRSTRTRKSVIDPDDVEIEPAKKKPRGKRASATKVSYEEEDNSNDPSKDSSKDDEFDPDEDLDEVVKPKTPVRGRGRGRKPAEHKDTPAPKSTGRGRGRKRQAPPEEEHAEEEDNDKDDKDHDDKRSERGEQSGDEVDPSAAKKPKIEETVEVKSKTTTGAVAAKTAATDTVSETAEKVITAEKKADISEKKDSEQKPTTEVANKKEEKATSETIAETKSEGSDKESSTNIAASEEKYSAAEPTKSTIDAIPAKEERASILHVTKEETKVELPPGAPSESAISKETSFAPAAKTEEPKEKAKENGLTATTESKESTGYEANSKADAPTEKDLSVASVVAPTATSGSGDVSRETKEMLEKTDGAEVVAVQKATPATAEAAESCGFKVVGSGTTILLLKPNCVQVIGEIETESLGVLAHQELDGLSSQAYRANVEAYLATHCCATDKYLVATLSARGKLFTLVNVQMETKNLSVAALLIGCLMRQLDSRPHAFIVTGHMPHVQPDSPAYELLRDGYFGNRSIETLLRMQDIRMDAEDEWDKGLVDFLWKAYQHSRPWMRSVYETVLNGETALSSTGRSMVWHSTKGVGVVGVLKNTKLVRADLAIYIRDS
ncbi:hypothetical protein BIW11_06398 [Tropilaelaps mercedesae]|uniref:Uncharacterized protein n=1 Tax=Tropilaelaps mercedesae TaxID=418985 RepID=A0A1V9XYE6_9ACAR|nr:hypothetical protein BIW11_06398 [Tropilaelaps mercedesae]